MGNICRSPMAEGAFCHLLQKVNLADYVYVDSAGTHSYHVGASPDHRSQQIASRRGVNLRAIKSRPVTLKDFATFDYILAMDKNNYKHLLDFCPQVNYRSKIQLFLDYAPDLKEEEVPDPYYGGLKGFEKVMNLVEEAALGLLNHIREKYHL
jgi:protein-tyrosine phosphatase